MGSIYDSPDIYDLLEDANRYLAYKRHWEHLFGGKNIESMLDISIGSGSVTLPVLDLNITLSGSDLSENMLKKCSKKISDKGFEPDLKLLIFVTFHAGEIKDLTLWQVPETRLLMFQMMMLIW